MRCSSISSMRLDRVRRCRSSGLPVWVVAGEDVVAVRVELGANSGVGGEHGERLAGGIPEAGGDVGFRHAQALEVGDERQPALGTPLGCGCEGERRTVRGASSRQRTSKRSLRSAPVMASPSSP